MQMVSPRASSRKSLNRNWLCSKVCDLFGFQHFPGRSCVLTEALIESEMKDCKVTFVVVGKRHHIRLVVSFKRKVDETSWHLIYNCLLRFNPINDADRDRSGNAPAGLVVDRDIGHPIEFDFYLQSQGGLLGTSRSSHYSVLYDVRHVLPRSLNPAVLIFCFVV